MKSAYERAMERLEAESGPTKKLTAAQRAKIADVEDRYDAKIAEARVSFESKIDANPKEAAKLREEMSSEIARFESKREEEKEAVWKNAG